MRLYDKICFAYCAVVLAAVFLLIGLQVGIAKGRMLGYEEANSQNQRMAFARAEAVVDQRIRTELNTCKRWIDGLGADLMKANSIIRGGC